MSALKDWLRACLHGGGGPQVGEVTRLPVVEKWLAFTCKLTTPESRGDITRRCYVVARHVNRENGGRMTHFGGQCSFLAATFQCRGFLLLLLMNLARFGALANVTWTRPRLGGLPHLESFTWQNATPAEHTDPNGGYDQNKMKRNKALTYFKQNCPIFRFAIQTFLRDWVEKEMCEN